MRTAPRPQPDPERDPEPTLPIAWPAATPPPPSGRAVGLARLSAIATAGAAAVHLGVANEHFAEWWLYGVFFLALAGVQGACAVAAWLADRGAVRLSVVVNLLTVALWAVTRTAGLPFGPDAGSAEAPGVADVVCVVLQLVAVVLAAAALRSWAGPASGRWPVGRWATGVTAGTAAAVLLAAGAALAAPGEHGDAMGGDAMGGDATSADGTADGMADGRAGMAMTGTGNGERHEMPDLPDVSHATAAQTAAARTLLQRTEAATARYRDVSAAKAAGFDVDAALARARRRHPDAAAEAVAALHVPNQANREDGRLLDPDAPETLIYHRDADGTYTLIGVMFTAEGQQPPTADAPYVRWHYHQVCVGGSRRLAQKPDDGSCPSGTTEHDTGFMTHLWFVRPDQLPQAFAMSPPKQALRAALGPVGNRSGTTAGQ